MFIAFFGYRRLTLILSFLNPVSQVRILPRALNPDWGFAFPQILRRQIRNRIPRGELTR
ncbi:hypothetical protein BH23ACT4_BH23ACT4_05120 [soil metagenome]